MKRLPIGNDEFREFREIREQDYYYVDKSMLIADFLAAGDKVTLIARPRRFGKTLNMTMVREFFDINVDSKAIFQGLSIMESEYFNQLNSRPVIYMSFRNCKGKDMDFFAYQIRVELSREFNRFDEILGDLLQVETYAVRQFKQMLQMLEERDLSPKYMTTALADLTRVIREHYGIAPLLLIDDYDQPIISSYEHGYHEEMGDFFSVFYGAGLKGNPDLGQAIMTGIQRVAKESIFSQLNNPKIYTVMTERYSGYFGLTKAETEQLLKYYGWELNSRVRNMYDGYRFADKEVYNPWSVLNYADSGYLDNYWVNTSSNYLIRQALEMAGIESQSLSEMFYALTHKDFKKFMDIYQNLVITSTSYMDTKENAYHMLFLGMCMTLRGSYQVSSNLETGTGRSDIILKALKTSLPNVIIEFKQGRNMEELRELALQQIIEQKHYAGLSGEVLCIGLAHDKKRCSVAYKVFMPENSN